MCQNGLNPLKAGQHVFKFLRGKCFVTPANSISASAATSFSMGMSSCKPMPSVVKWYTVMHFEPPFKLQSPGFHRCAWVPLWINIFKIPCSSWTGFISVPTMPVFARRPAAEAENLEAEECQLDPASLAGKLEADVRIRNRLRYKEEGRLLRWMKNEKGKDMVGQLSMTLIAMNVRALTILARYWCPKAKKIAKSPSIHLVRKEARFGNSPSFNCVLIRYQTCSQSG